MVALELRWLDAAGLRRAQMMVTAGHYLHRPVDARCSVQGYSVHVAGELAGVLLFGRPQATVCRPWYGSLEDLAAGRVACSRWEIINLARVYLLPHYQAGGSLCTPDLLPGYTSRGGHWVSTLASTVIRLALERIVVDYLLARPPVWPEEPYQLAWCLSYCDRRLHRGVVYRESGFSPWWPSVEAVWEDKPLWTYRKALRSLTPAEDAQVRRLAQWSPRSLKYRQQRYSAGFEQVALFG
jgi:hypothetical protein